MTVGRIYQDSDFAIQDGSVLWRRLDGMMLMLAHASKDDINYLESIGFCGTPSDPALYEVLSDMSRDCDEILIYDGQGNLLHRMEDKDGLHRGTTQKVHGSAAGSSGGSQSTGTGITLTPTGSISITQSPGYISWSNPGSPSTYSIGTQGSGQIGYYQALAQSQLAQAQAHAQALNSYTPIYGSSYTVATTGTVSLPVSIAGGVSAAAFTEYQKKIKDEGIRVGEIVAYRCWPIKNGFLWSTAADRAWAPGEPMKAGENHLRDGLGVYAFKEMSRCIHEFGCECYSNGIAFGSIYIWGEIIEHELGYRAERAIIRSIDFVKQVPDRLWHPQYVEDLRKMYKVEGK